MITNGAGDAIATRIATAVQQRRSLRRLAQGTFLSLATVAAGGRTRAVRDLLGDVATFGGTCSGPGPGCPGSEKGHPCGPSRCCNFTRPGTPSTGPNSCDCSVTSNATTCKTNGTGTGESTNCFGDDTRFYASQCWTCVGPCFDTVDGRRRYTTTCCDCKTHAGNCDDPDKGNGRGRCVAFHYDYGSC